MSLPFIDQAKQMFEQVLHSSSEHEESALGVDIGASSIKVVQLRKEQNVALLETYGEIALGPLANADIGQEVNLPPETLAEAVKQVVQAANVTVRTCGVSVPFASSLIKLIEVPPLDEKQLATVIPIEARKYIPVPIQEVQLDWFIVPETEQRLFDGVKEADTAELPPLTKRMVLLVAMHNEMLAKYNQTLTLAGITPAFFEIEVFSNIRATISRSLAPVAIIDLGASTSKLYIVELGIILSSHVVQVGAQDITKSLANATHISVAKAEEVKRQAGILAGAPGGSVANVSHAATLTMEQVFGEVRRVILNFERRYNKAITKVILTGGGATLKGLADFSRQQLELEVEVADPFAHVQAPPALRELLRDAGPDFAVALGLALRRLGG